jgi:hypothetical protein
VAAVAAELETMVMVVAEVVVLVGSERGHLSLLSAVSLTP